jgi:two-component SAPR family response regulator
MESLPSDPSAALVQFAHRVQTLSATRNALQKFKPQEVVAIMSFYERFITKFAIDVKGVNEIISSNSKFTNETLTNVTHKIIVAESKLLERTIVFDIDDIISKYASNIDEDSFGFAKLNLQEKNKIHEHINRIRTLIDLSELSDRKKNALLERLNNLAREVDQYGTRTDQFFAFMGDVAFVMGDMSKKAKPLIEEVKDMMKILSRSRARQEGVSLPPGDETVLLPPPEDEGG